MNENTETQSTPEQAPVQDAPSAAPAAPVDAPPAVEPTPETTIPAVQPDPAPAVVAAPEPPAAPVAPAEEAPVPPVTGFRFPPNLLFSQGSKDLREGVAALKDAVLQHLATNEQNGFHMAVQWLEETDRFLRKVHAQLLDAEDKAAAAKVGE